MPLRSPLCSYRPLSRLARSACLAAVLWLLSAPAGAQSIEVLVFSGDPTPDGLNSFDFDASIRPSLYGQHVVFSSDFTGVSGDDGVFRVTPSGQIFAVAQSGELAPSGRVVSDLYLPSLPSVNALGQLVYAAFVTGMPDDQTALFRGNESEWTEVFEEGDPAPGSGELALPVGSQDRLAALINDAGDIAFSARLTQTPGGLTDNEAIYRWDGASGTLTEIVRKGDPPPNGIGTFTGTTFQASEVFAPPAMNEAGQVGFLAAIENSGVALDEGVYISDGTQTVRVARTGASTPDGGTFSDFSLSAVSMNESGSVAFAANFTGNSALDGVYRGNGTTLTRIAEVGQVMPVPGISYLLFERGVDLNDSGTVAFVAALGGAPCCTYALFAGDGSSTILLARPGDPATPGDGTFRNTNNTAFALNNAGQIAFETPLTVGGSAETGIFFHDPGTGLVKIARTGDPLEGSTITALELNATDTTIRSLPDQADGLNDAGQVAFAFELADGRAGVAIWQGAPQTVPGLPAPVALLLAALLLSCGVARIRCASPRG